MMGGFILLVIVGALAGVEDEPAMVPPVDLVGPPGAAQQPAAPNYAAASIQPGMWESGVQVTDFSSTVPGLTREALGNMNNAAATRDCISPQEAANPTQALVDLAKSTEGDCASDAMRFAGGTISGQLRCTQGGMVHSDLDLSGSYTPTSMDMNFYVTQNAQQNGQNYEVRYNLRMKSYRVGDC